MNHDAYQKLVSILDQEAIPLSIGNQDYTALLDKIGDARFVMIGEASHGTQEFYQARIDITKQLVAEKGFMAVAIEGDWPDAYRIHRYLQGTDPSENLESAFDGFKRFPTWMWRNTTMLSFVQWLRECENKIGFYGLDLYSLNASMEAVISYLEERDPEAAERAKMRYACFEPGRMDLQTYGYLTAAGIKKSCIDEVVKELVELQHRTDGDELLSAIQNARVVKNAETYYRSMFEESAKSWNIRDQHMAETLDLLAEHLERLHKRPAKIVVWAHNSHVGDARATEMSERGEVNIGQLVRERHPDTYSIGFSTYDGFVTAADNWDFPAERKQVVPGLVGSYEELFHCVKHKNFLLNLTGNKQLEHFLSVSRLQRAIGVIYRPETERMSHYFFTHLPQQFDSIIHFDHTSALVPL